MDTRIADRLEITDVLYRYCRAVDRRAYELLASIYHDDATEVHGSYRGLASNFFQDYVQPRQADRLYVMHHLTTILIDFQSADVAFAESYLLGMDVRPDGDGYIERATYGRYLDRFERRDGSPWLIAERAFLVDWASDRRFDEVPDYPPAGYLRSARDRSDTLFRLLDTGHVE